MRPGGGLIFLANSALLSLCVPDENGVAASDRLLSRSGFEVVDLIEIQAPEAGTTGYDPARVGAPVALGGDLEGATPLTQRRAMMRHD